MAFLVYVCTIVIITFYHITQISQKSFLLDAIVTIIEKVIIPFLHIPERFEYPKQTIL